MFEKYKLNKYKNHLAGFAYELSNLNSSGHMFNRIVHVQFYMVMKENQQYKIIKYRKFRNVYAGLYDNYIFDISLNELITKQHENEHQVLPDKTLVKK